MKAEKIRIGKIQKSILYYLCFRFDLYRNCYTTTFEVGSFLYPTSPEVIEILFKEDGEYHSHFEYDLNQYDYFNNYNIGGYLSNTERATLSRSIKNLVKHGFIETKLPWNLAGFNREEFKSRVKALRITRKGAEYLEKENHPPATRVLDYIKAYE